MAFAFRHQPLKGIYMLGSVLALLFVRLPLWTVLSLVPSGRPLPSWTLGRSLILRVFQAYVGILYNTSVETPVRPQPDASNASKSCLVWVEPTPDLILGDIRDFVDANNVKPESVPGYWNGSRASDGPVG